MKPPKRDQRLLSSRQFRAVYNGGQKFNTPFFSAFILSTETGLQRMGLTTTRKIGDAVLRNRCRRRLREIFRLRDRAAFDGMGFDVVFNLRPSAATAEFQDMQSAFSQVLLRYRQNVSKSNQSEGEK